MPNKWANYKLLIAMLFFVMFIQLSTLLYIWQVQSKVLLEKERTNLSYQLDIDAKLLLHKMKSFEQELKFLATLEVMDDILVGDLDKRILVLLEKKSSDLGEGIVLQALNEKGLVASSKEKINLKEYFSFQVAVFSSFDTHKKIGSLKLLYPLQNFRELNKENPHQSLWIEPFSKREAQNSIVVSQELTGLLEGLKLFLAYEKKYALESIEEIERILVFTLLFSLIALLFVIWVLSKKQVNILEHTQEVLDLKRTFLSTMSHELRTPLGSILNLTQHLMISPKIGNDEVEMLIKVENASEHLLEMINNLLQLSKLESNSMTVTKERIDLVELIEEMIELVEPLIDEKGLVLEKKIAPNLKYMLTDVNLLKQVVINLLSNAMKYTEKGKISVQLIKREGYFEFSIVDTGIGIDKEKQKALFSEFYQAHSKEIKHSTGLGLALSQKVAKLIDGEIFIESRGLGFGTKALFRFGSLR